MLHSIYVVPVVVHTHTHIRRSMHKRVSSSPLSAFESRINIRQFRLIECWTKWERERKKKTEKRKMEKLICILIFQFNSHCDVVNDNLSLSLSLSDCPEYIVLCIVSGMEWKIVVRLCVVRVVYETTNYHFKYSKQLFRVWSNAQPNWMLLIYT